MEPRASVNLRDSRVLSIEVGPKWTFITIKVRTDSIAAQGAPRILGKPEGVRVKRKIRAKVRQREKSKIA
jgi:hypothetical protein